MEPNFIKFAILQPQLSQLQLQPSYTYFTIGSKLCSYFSQPIIQPLPKETAKYYCDILSLRVLRTHVFRMLILYELHLQADYCQAGGSTHMQTRAAQK